MSDLDGIISGKGPPFPKSKPPHTVPAIPRVGEALSCGISLVELSRVLLFEI
jgi:hypothetical protein